MSCTCRGSYCVSCAHEFMVNRNNLIVQYGYFVGIIFSPCCGSFLFDAMHSVQRSYLLKFRDCGQSIIERGFWMTIHGDLYPDFQETRLGFYRVIKRTNPDAWRDCYSDGYLEQFRYSGFESLMIRSGVSMIAAKPVFQKKLFEAVAVDFLDIQGQPYANSHEAEAQIYNGRHHSCIKPIETDLLGQPFLDYCKFKSSDDVTEEIEIFKKKLREANHLRLISLDGVEAVPQISSSLLRKWYLFSWFFLFG